MVWRADVAQPDQARIVGINAQYFLKNSGNFVISIKASCIDSTAPPEAVFAREVTWLYQCSHAFLMQRMQAARVQPSYDAWHSGYLCIRPSYMAAIRVHFGSSLGVYKHAGQKF